MPYTFCFEIEIPDEKGATLPPLVVTVRLMDPASDPTKVENLYSKLAKTVANAKARVKQNVSRSFTTGQWIGNVRAYGDGAVDLENH